jgi:Fe-S oxidoreductase
VANAPDLATARAAVRRALRGPAAFHAEACVRCGLCGESCHIWLAEPEPANLPGYKAARVVAFLRRDGLPLGRVAPFLVGAREPTPAALEELAEVVFGRCTACGRCGLHCSVGADVAALVRAGRAVVTAAGLTPGGLRAVVENQLTTGNQMAVTAEELRATTSWLAEDLRAEMGRADVRLPVDEPGARVLYLVNPREIKFFPLSLSAAAGVFTAAGESWTLSSRFFDVTNYGLFAADDAAARTLTERVMEEAARLGVREVILSECGHGFRAFRWEGPNWLGRRYALPVRSVLELVWEYVASGRIKVDPAKNPARVTLHDPCNLVRWGGISEPQRRILKAVCADVVEMTPNREQNYCCGGGGGLLSLSEYGERRIASGATKAEQIRRTGAKVVATPCHNCADQLLELNKHYKLGVEIMSVSELAYNALIT